MLLTWSRNISSGVVFFSSISSLGPCFCSLFSASVWVSPVWLVSSWFIVSVMDAL